MAPLANTLQCDRAEPGCNRCQKIGKVCPGYRLESELLFKNQTDKTVARSRRVHDKLDTLTNKPATSMLQPLSRSQDDGLAGDEDVFAKCHKVDPPTCHGRLSVPSFGPVIKIPPSVPNSESFDDEAICLFLADYVQAPQEGWPKGHLEFLPSILHQTQPDSCLSHAVHAVAYRYLYNIRTQSPIQSRAQYYYSQSLKSIHKALEDPMERLNDSTLLAVWLVGLYEASKHPVTCSMLG